MSWIVDGEPYCDYCRPCLPRDEKHTMSKIPADKLHLYTCSSCGEPLNDSGSEE